MRLRQHVSRGVPGLVVALLVGACGDNPAPMQPPPPAVPEVTEIAVSLNPNNNLSTIVTFETKNAESARVVYWQPGPDSVFAATPYYPVTDGEQRFLTLGLKPLANYAHVVETIGPEGETTSDPVELVTGDLPEFFKNNVAFNVTGTATPGYVLVNFRVAPNIYTAAFDGEGRVCWYQAFDVLGGFVRQHPNGNFSAFLGTTTGYHPRWGYFAEFTPEGEIVARHQAPPPLYTDNHELLLRDGTAHLFSYDIRRVDLTAYGGQPDALVAAHQILRFGPGGIVEFMWNGWDHLGIDHWIAGRLPGACDPDVINCDLDHPNSLWIDNDGHYILSVRNFSQIWKINSSSGDRIWKLGGADGDFQFMNDPQNGFSSQHYARTLANGNILLYDNGNAHAPAESRAVEYELDPVAHTATMVWEFRHAPPFFTGALGYAKRLSNGNTVIGFGAIAPTNRSVVSEVDPEGNVVWEGEVLVNNRGPGVYRFVKIASLYEYDEL